MAEAEAKPPRQMKLYAVRTVAGRELDVALIAEMRAKTENVPIASITILPDIRGYIIVEAPAAHHVATVIHGIRYAKGIVPGILKTEEVEKLLKPQALIEALKPGDFVEIVSGPFRGMKGQVVRVDKARNEVVLKLLDASYPLQITVPGGSVRPMRERR